MKLKYYYLKIINAYNISLFIFGMTKYIKKSKKWFINILYRDNDPYYIILFIGFFDFEKKDNKFVNVLFWCIDFNGENKEIPKLIIIIH